MSGVITLSEFRDMMAEDTGFRGHGNPKLDLWVNLGYREVASAHPHKILLTCATKDLEVGTFEFGMPANALEVISLVDVTNERVLLRTAADNIVRRRRANFTGKAEIWGRIGDRIRLQPTLKAATSLDIIYVREPDRLTAASDVSILPAIWDNAIYLFAMSHGKNSLGKEEEGGAWFTRAVAYMRSRVTEYYWQADSLTAPLELPQTREALTGTFKGIAP